MLTQFQKDIWTCSAKLKLFGVELGTRMTVVRLNEDGALLVHSPIALTSELKEELDRLGTVTYVVAPNKWHHFYVADFEAAYPKATFFCAPGLEKKRKDLKFDRVIGADQDHPWNPVLEHILVEGIPIFNEVVFFHPPTRTLIVTDLALHICHSHSLFTRAVLTLLGSYGKFGWAPAERLLYIRNKLAFETSVARILEWDFDRILLTHGEPIQAGGKQRMREEFAP